MEEISERTLELASKVSRLRKRLEEGGLQFLSVGQCMGKVIYIFVRSKDEAEKVENFLSVEEKIDVIVSR